MKSFYSRELGSGSCVCACSLARVGGFENRGRWEVVMDLVEGKFSSGKVPRHHQLHLFYTPARQSTFILLSFTLLFTTFSFSFSSFANGVISGEFRLIGKESVNRTRFELLP